MTQASDAPANPPRTESKETFLAAAIIVIALAVYACLFVAGQTHRRWLHTGYYDLLAQGFVRGHVSLPVDPPAALLSLPDPYDPAANQGLRLHDASLFHGHYYLYWGPLPAVVLAGVRLLRLHRGVAIGDQYVVFPFVVGMLLVNALLILRIRRTLFPEQPWWTSGIALIAAAFAAPVMFLFRWASVYEAAIAGGQFFFLAGIYCAFRALSDRARSRGSIVGNVERPPHRRVGVLAHRFRRNPDKTVGEYAHPTGSGSTSGQSQNEPIGWLIAASLAWGCAIASRFSLILAIGGIALMIIWRVMSLRPIDWSRRVAIIVAFLCPMGVSCALLLAYNQARFGSPLDFGTTYQLTSLNGYRSPPPDVLFSPKNILPNLDRIFLETIEFLPDFPFIRCGEANVPRYIRQHHLPREFAAEPVAGFVTSLPFAYLALIPPLVLAWRAIRRQPAQIGCDLGNSGLEKWLTLCLIVASLLTLPPILLVLASTMRYLADVAPSLILLASVGMWQALRISHPTRGRFDVRVAGVIILAIVGAAMGILLAFPAPE